MAEVPWTADQVEVMFHAALKAGDVQGVDAALRVMLRLDVDRAEFLYDALRLAIKDVRYRAAPTIGLTHNETPDEAAT